MPSNRVFSPVEIIPRFFTLLADQQPLTIQGSGLNVRRYLYGADAADGFDTILHKGAVGEAYNISSSSAVTNLEVAVRMLDLFGYTPHSDFRQRLVWIPDRPFNDHDYRVNGSKLELLGWRQRVSFPDGLDATVSWYRRNIHDWWPDMAKTFKTTSKAITNGDMSRNHVSNGKLDDVRDGTGFEEKFGGSDYVAVA